MQVAFRQRKLEKCANQKNYADAVLGPLRAKRFLARLTEFHAATCLADLRNLPQAGHHELTGDRHGQLACALDHPYRLIYTPAHDPIPKKEDGGLDWQQVTAVTIQDIVDYHG